ncbi:hypothetical protein HUJ04_009371 [Dendroctonus ponderosae]|nr:hypothetical protein HUJ04_009371 [Dendroctonus ponderosae]
MKNGTGDFYVDMDHIQVGFRGTAKGEQTTAEAEVQTTHLVPYRLRFWPRTDCKFKLGPSESSCSLKCKCCCQLLSQWMLSQVGLTIVVIIWALLGAYAFYVTEGPREQKQSETLAQIQRDLSTALAVDLNNSKHLDTWPTMIHKYFEKHETLFLEAVGAGFGEGGGGNIWTYPGCILFSVALLTTLVPIAMTEERVKLLKLLYSADYPAEWEFDENVKEYLTKLAAYKVEDLIKEPRRLEVEFANIQDQTQDLAVTNYKTFIETAECSRQLFSQFSSIEHKLDELLLDIPKFQTSCTSFCDSTSQISNLRKLNSLTLTKNAQLLEILELPQLMNSFINDGLYEDALELAAYVRKLCSKHSDIPIFASILDDVNRAWLLMLHQLLNQLKQDVALPRCLQIVGHLRRMEVFTELELKLKFLQARGHWLDLCLKYIPKDDVDHHLTKTVELTRINLFNIITQYRAIFSDGESVPTSSLKGVINENMIFFTWINARISDFLEVLEGDLKSVSSVESLLDQCMYFGLSFSKVGCDFRSLLIPIFTKQIMKNFSAAIGRAVAAFEKSIENFTLINKNLPNIPWNNKHQDPLQPPDSLLEFYPLAEYLNNVLKTLNSFRICAPVAIVSEVVECLQRSLLIISRSIVNLYSQEQQAFTSSAKGAFTRLCMSFSDDLVPYVQKCVHIIYPPTQIASQLGITLQTLQDERISFLNREAIVEPIRHLLPSKMSIEEVTASK